MNDRETRLEAILQTLFRDVDTTADFEARVLARLRSDSLPELAEEMNRARQVERERYRRASLEVKNGLRATLQRWALDGLGIAGLSVVVLIGAWGHLGPSAIERLAESGPFVATLLGVLLVIVPLVGMWVERYRYPLSQG
jgi:predicted anti-sigma-YlaC factor YlaD